MEKQHNRRIFAGFYKRYDNKYIYVVAVVPDVDIGVSGKTDFDILKEDLHTAPTANGQWYCTEQAR